MNSYSEFSRVVTLVASLTFSFGLYAQCIKLFRTAQISP